MEATIPPTPSEATLTPESRLRVTPTMKASLLSSMKWIQFFVILTCVAVGLLLIAAVFMIVFGSIAPDTTDDVQPLVFLALGIFYLLIAAAYLYPVIRAFKLVDHTRRALRAGTNSDFEAAADDLYAVLRFCGYLTFAILALYILFMIGTVIFLAITQVNT